MKINIVKPFLPELHEISEDISKILNNGLVTNNGEYVQRFEKNLQEKLNSKLTPIIFNNGESALFSLIQYYKYKITGSLTQSFEVIVPSFTFVGTINAIVLNGLTPVFCDIDESLTLDVDKILVTKNTKLLVAVGAYGNLPNLEKLKKFKKENNIEIIFDNAPAFLSTYENDYVCNHGFSEIYSFHASKIMNSVEGGCVITNDEETHENLKYLRDFGQYEKNVGNIKLPGLNSKMSEIHAIIGLNNLKKTDYILESRHRNIDRYREFFEELENLNLVKTMKVEQNVKCNYLYFPIVLNVDNNEFVEFMLQNNVMVRKYYTSTHTLDFYKSEYSNLNLEFTEKIKNKVVSIPIHTEMSDDEINYIFNTIKKYFMI